MSKELLEGLGSVTTNGSSVTRTNEYLLFTGYVWAPATTAYIPIQDPTHTFRYDITYESDVGNYFYIGIERFDKDKATGSNNCCIYQVATSNAAKSKQRIQGTINLNQAISSSNTNKTAFIRLRILNQWTNSSGTGVTAKIYHLSVREIIDNTATEITKKGQLIADTMWEGYDTAAFGKVGTVDSNSLIEY